MIASIARRNGRLHAHNPITGNRQYIFEELPMKGIRLVEDFIEESKIMGYEISGSVFKADYNGISWTVGIWVRPSKLVKGEYELPGRIGKAMDGDFKKAVKKAVQKARRLDP